jgi:hypothetical protein
VDKVRDASDPVMANAILVQEITVRGNVLRCEVKQLKGSLLALALDAGPIIAILGYERVNRLASKFIWNAIPAQPFNSIGKHDGPDTN